MDSCTLRYLPDRTTPITVSGGWSSRLLEMRWPTAGWPGQKVSANSRFTMTTGCAVASSVGRKARPCNRSMPSVAKYPGDTMFMLSSVYPRGLIRIPAASTEAGSSPSTR